MNIVNRLVSAFCLFTLLACSSEDSVECVEQRDCPATYWCETKLNKCFKQCSCNVDALCVFKCCGHVCEECTPNPSWCSENCPEGMVCDKETCDCVSNERLGMICPDGDSNCPIEFPVCLEDVGPSGYCTKPCMKAGDCGWPPWCCEDHGKGFFCWDVEDCLEEQ